MIFLRKIKFFPIESLEKKIIRKTKGKEVIHVQIYKTWLYYRAVVIWKEGVTIENN